MLDAGLALHGVHQGDGGGRTADQAQHIEGHRQVRRLPRRFDQVQRAWHVLLFSRDQREECPNDGPLADLSLGRSGGSHKQEKYTERGGENAVERHLKSPGRSRQQEAEAHARAHI